MLLFLGVLLCIDIGVNADVRSYLKEMELIPDVFDENITIPDQLLTMFIGDQKLINGNEYLPTFMMKMPTIEMNFDPNDYYTIVFLSPDWISRELQNLKHFLFWLKTNIRGNDLKTGDTIVEYIPPAPLKSSGEGRGIFILYKQTGKLIFDEPYVTARMLDFRSPWSLQNFVSKYNLGHPKAILAGTSRWDGNVPKMHLQFLKKTK